MSTTIATTGITGFFGSHLRTALEATGRVVDNMPLNVRRSNDAARQWLETRHPAALIHIAGIGDVRYCHQHPLEAVQAHAMETANLLEAVRQTCPAMPVLYVATDKSFGEQQNCGLETPYRPIYPYEASKACEDLLVESYRESYQLQCTLLRFPNFIGEGDRHGERLVPGICRAAVEGREFTIRTRLDGTTRQYIYAGDASDIVVRTLTACLRGEPVWPRNHFGPPHIKTVGDVIRDITTILGRSVDVTVLNQPGEVSQLSLRDENWLGYRYTDWLPALGRTLEWYERNR
jgi:nucleoside-diphosphate-sugar epimerase